MDICLVLQKGDVFFNIKIMTLNNNHLSEDEDAEGEEERAY